MLVRLYNSWVNAINEQADMYYECYKYCHKRHIDYYILADRLQDYVNTVGKILYYKIIKKVV